MGSDDTGGVLLATSYLTHAGHYATSHFCDAAFLESWISDPAFRMVK